jgi:hypothetical protein
MFLCRMRATLPLFLLLAQVLYAQTPIAQARQSAVGATVTVRGIVLNAGELGGIRYMQDATAGIAAFPGTGSQPGFAPPRGADVTVTGVLKLFNGLLEIDPITSYTVHSTNNPLPSPQLITPAQVGEAYESSLVRVNGCLFDAGGQAFASGTTPFSTSGQSGVVYLRSGHPLVGTTIPTGPVDLLAIVSQYSTSTPPSGGYQLLLRNTADILSASGIVITSEVTQDGIAPEGFNLRWSTNIAGSSEVAYGPTPSLGSFASGGGGGTSHEVTLSGLAPATFYHARAFSVAGGDTAWAPTGLYSTASEVPGSIRVYFNQEVDNTVALTTPAIRLNNAFDDTVRAHIDAALHMIDYAVYNTSFAGIVTALNNAHGRGVQVRVIAEGSTSNSAFSNLNSGIPVLYRNSGGGSGMHNKFLAIDADVPDRARTITGSTNMTSQSFFSDANNLVIVHDQALTRCYRAEFEEMWGGSGPLPDVQSSRFGSSKTDNTPHLFNVGGTLVECYFSPSDGTTARIADAIGTADHSVEFALFSFTHYGLADALIDAEQRPGVTVRGLIESDDMNTALFAYLQDGGVLVGTDQMSAYLHHKYAIVDRANAASDPLVITGSHNWSYNAENLNDENTLIVHSAVVADHFHQEWRARWVHAAVGVEEVTGTDGLLHVWPNPVSDRLMVRSDDLASGHAQVIIHDALGRHVMAMQRMMVPGMNTWSMDTDGLAGGMYRLTLEQGDHRMQVAFVRE